MLRCEHDSDDAVQEAFISAFRSMGGFAGGSKLSTWLHRIVVNVCLMKLRARRPRREASIEPLLPQFDEHGHHAATYSDWGNPPAVDVSLAETRAQVRACIDELPEAYRTVVLLRDIEELDTQETASLLGVSEANVKVRLHRARQALRTLLDPIFTERSRSHNVQWSAA
jgi:RNA polymerase sigma-70 factor (ECF subfamily)